MQLRIAARDLPLAPVTRRAVERRVRLALSRHAREIATALVSLAPALSREGAPVHRARIRVRLKRGDVLVVEGESDGSYAAVARASWRMEHRLERDRHARGLGARGSLRRRSSA